MSAYKQEISTALVTSRILVTLHSLIMFHLTINSHFLSLLHTNIDFAAELESVKITNKAQAGSFIQFSV